MEMHAEKFYSETGRSSDLYFFALSENWNYPVLQT
jgi:hypothetical protein